MVDYQSSTMMSKKSRSSIEATGPKKISSTQEKSVQLLYQQKVIQKLNPRVQHKMPLVSYYCRWHLSTSREKKKNCQSRTVEDLEQGLWKESLPLKKHTQGKKKAVR